MNAAVHAVLSLPATPSENRARRLLARMNMTLFYVLGIAVLVETAAERQAADGLWPTGPASGRARWLRTYAENLWPELSWQAACDAFCRHARLDGWHGAGDRGAARRIVCRHLAQFYETVGRIAEDEGLRAALTAMAAEAHLHRGRGASGGIRSALREWHLARRFVDHMRDGLLCRAFETLQQHCGETAPFPPMTYAAFLDRTWMLLVPHLKPPRMQRLLHCPWFRHRKPTTYPGTKTPDAETAFSRSDARQVSVSPALPQPALLR